MTVYAVRWAKSGRPSSGPAVAWYPEEASQTFKRGDPVKLDNTGEIEAAVDTGGSIGYADKDASGTTGTLIPVVLWNQDDLFTASLSEAGATHTLVQTDVGERCSWIKSSVSGETDKTVVDLSDTQGDVVEIVGLRDPVGTVDGRVYFRIVATQIIPEGA
jgi:hypothetical protein